MGIDVSQLPPAAQKQVLQKLREAGIKQEERPEKKRNKYGNKKTTVDGIQFDSKKESERYVQLYMMMQNGYISDLRMQAEFTLQEAFTDYKGYRTRAIRYKADFTYIESGKLIVEDVKSDATRKNPVYRMKKKMMREKYGIEIKEF